MKMTALSSHQPCEAEERKTCFKQSQGGVGGEVSDALNNSPGVTPRLQVCAGSLHPSTKHTQCTEISCCAPVCLHIRIPFHPTAWSALSSMPKLGQFSTISKSQNVTFNNLYNGLACHFKAVVKSALQSKLKATGFFQQRSQRPNISPSAN